MNLTDERAIYEWLRDELKGKTWTLVHSEPCYCNAPVIYARVGRTRAQREMDLPPLDPNTTFREAIPKLLAEFRSVKWDGETWTIYVPQCYGEPASWKNADFYAALLQYLGVK